ncbi:HD domain-containing protein [Rudaeicoccus suwonensis]|uniref:Putative metal-dependent HD superfamily phosphohydrolase n=1 Tax=Rudaeicoccus suwonensis TaxID=657409 RepID=A0A561ECP2_9MICO|nr:metal-dependent phosphohydrolase [Rudaeicoccus suwonensis]TWE13386.1 putative metal-dependent HD superfamily phosphohydrolase [Rudaeicoccus suwonensis]
MTGLLDSWVRAITELSPTADPAQARRDGEGLLLRWNEGHRSYHTAQHLNEVLSALNLLGGADRPAERALATLAAWLHDAVYDVTAEAGASERASATLATAVLTGLGCREDIATAVEQLILMTTTHQSRSADPVGDALHDADLWILAAPMPRFRQYCEQVRTEYRHVPDPAYAEARTGILCALVDRADVYRTARAREEWTAAARSNVASELRSLSTLLPDRAR